MTQEDRTFVSPSSSSSSSPSSPVGRGPRRWRGLWVALAVMLFGGATAATAARAYGFGGGWRHGGGGEMMERRIARLLDKVGATEAQKTQIKTIWEGLRPELKTLHQQKEQIRKQIAQAAAAPTIDAAQVEQLRRQSVQLMDQGSSVFTRGLLATAQVLTPEQRKQVLAEMDKRHRKHGPGHHDGEAAR
jgi:Spy/CpxP family protein refolding chaperone